MQITGLPPIVPYHTKRAKILILGSMPSSASISAQAYYAHPQNAFWKIIVRLLNAPPHLSYPQRCRMLRQNGIALWDVLAACERVGSLDSAIVKGSEQVNDIHGLLTDHPAITTIATNGGTARTLFCRHFKKITETHQVVFLPSTSPANARMRFEEKYERWAVLKSYL